MQKPSDTYEFEAIGTHWWLERLDDGVFTKDIKQAISVYVNEFDRRYSRFRDDSLVAELARTGVLENPPREMLGMLRFAEEMSTASHGAFSLFVGNDLQQHGYGTLHVPDAPVGRSNNVLKWNEERVSVAKGVVLEFGGFGKGWMIDDISRLLRKRGVNQYIVNGGGDLYVDAAGPVQFALEHPYDPTQKIGDVNIQKGALAASSTVKRAWENDGKPQHHIVDPETGESSSGNVVASFVLADTALIADTMATILILRPELEGTLKQHYNLQTIILHKSSPV